MAAGTTITSSVPEAELPPDDLPEVEAEVIEPTPDPAIEARAREMGWKPLAEYRGPPGKWRPADEFIARGEEILPIVREQNRALTARLGRFEGEITGLRSTVAEQLQIIKDLRDMGQRADQRGYDRAMKDIRAKQGQAVEAGDTKAWQQLVEQEEALRESHASVPLSPPAAATTEPKPATPPVSEATKAFVAANPWFNRDKVLNTAMISHHIEVLQEGQILDEAGQYEEAKQRVIDAYPDRFPQETAREPVVPPPRPRRRAATVAAPTAEPPPPRPNAVASTINSIADPTERAEAREAFNRMKRNMPDYSEAEYMALYTNPHANVLEVQQKIRSAANGR